MIIPTLAQQFELILVFLLVAVAVILLSYSVSKTQFSRKVDCKPQKDWGLWGDCTRNCIGGNQYRTRAVDRMALHGGKNCVETDLLQSRSCNSDIQCGINCIPGNPSNFEWTPCPQCTKNAGQPIQYKTVIPARQATYMGQDCDIDSVVYKRECVNVPPCPPDIDCELTPYAYSDCNVPCGSGTRYVYSKITRLPSGDGAECNLADLVQQESCFDQPCGCENLSWSGTFSECNAACGPGIKVMMRAPVTDANPGFCPYVSVTACELIACPNTTCNAPSIDFVQALCYMKCAGLPFPEIDPLICGYEQGGFSQDILNAVCSTTIYGNTACAEPIDCSLSSFSAFGGCSIGSCLAEQPYGGKRSRIRTIVQPGNSGGASCVDQVLIDVQPCFNRLPVSYSAFDTTTQEFIQSVSSPQCSNNGCSLSAWYSITGFLGGCGPCSQEWVRSLSFIGNVDQCPTDPALFYSLSTCCGRNPKSILGICQSLPPCTQCMWDDIRNYSFNCKGVAGNQEVYRDMRLVSNSNNPLVDCQTSGFLCYDDGKGQPTPGPDQYSNSPLSCSRFVFSCTNGGGPNACPIGCNGETCNGQGQCFQFATSYSCACYSGYTGKDCDVPVGRCPVASISELECNGFGTCNSLTCVCDNPNDQTVDCTGSSTSWCWIYGNITGRLVSQQTLTELSSVKKLLGVIPIASTTDYYFSEDDCRQVETIALDAYLDSVSIYTVRPLFLTSEAPNVAPIVYRMGLSGKVDSRVPFTLADKLSLSCVPEVTSTYDLLTDGLGLSKSQYFVPRYVPFSSPIQCESIFAIRTLSGLASFYYNDSQLNLSSTVLGPVLKHYYT